MLVSVIIPTYNRAATISRAVESVLQQSYHNFEIIVVDDGSTDSTHEVLSRFNGRIKVIQQPNAGPSSARNRGIRAASGSVLTFLDSDDVWLPEKVEQQVRLLTLGGEKMVCCVSNAIVIDEAGTQRTSFQNAGLSISVESGHWKNPCEVLMTRFVLFNQVAAVRREAIDRIGGFKEDLRLLEDYDLAMRLSALGGWGIIRKPLVIKYNDTRGIGVVAMRDPKQVLPASAMALRSLLSERDLWTRTTQQLLNKSLRAVENEMRLNCYLASNSAPLRLLGRAGLGVLHVGGMLRRRLPGWPQPEVAEIDPTASAASTAAA